VIVALSASIVSGCGAALGVTGVPNDGEPLSPAANLVIVAHEDDDLLFFQPELHELVSNHAPLTVLYVTAGDAEQGVDYADSRLFAEQNAYSLVSGVGDWTCGWTWIAQHPAWHCRLPDANVSLISLAYPDGGIPGNFPESLLHLWQGDITKATTVSRAPSSYDQHQLIATVASVIEQTQPTKIRTLDIAATHGADNSDHLIVGALAVIAAASAHANAQIVSYRGYNMLSEPVNHIDPVYDRVSLGMRAYEACQTGCAACGDACSTIQDAHYNAWAHRHYAIASRAAPLAGVLATTRGCLAVADDGTTTIGNCDGSSTTVMLAPGGAILAGDRCLGVASSGAVVATACTGGPEQYFVLDDEGHIWSGLVAPPAPNMLYDHTSCLVGDGGIARVATCGMSRDARWQLVRLDAVATPRAQLGAIANAHVLRLGDITGDGLADLCAIANGGLWCAPGDGTGAFGAAVRVDAKHAPLAIFADSLALGDVDGDGLVDACGRDARGVVCATAASNFAAQRWSAAFSALESGPATDRSLAIVDRQVCALGVHGVQCTAEGGAGGGEPQVLSNWPLFTAPLWPADFDGDGKPDWCAATNKGPQCGLAAQRMFTTEAAPWGFAQNDNVDGAKDDLVLAPARTGAADVSGDGRADLCAIVGSTVQCAVSLGRSFAPRTPIFIGTAGATYVALALGDLDGDGRADACVDDGVAITCTPSP
jgi:hypothetical protein